MIAVDVETECGKPGCEKKCEHAVHPWHNRITVIGVYGDAGSFCFRSLTNFQAFLNSRPNEKMIGHNFKFDLQTLLNHGINIHLDQWVGDTQLMAAVYPRKIPRQWLENYEEKRKQLNKQIRGTHRHAGSMSLKTLAPYFLGVEPFWEDPADHDSDQYVLKDCEYTYKLFHYFNNRFEPRDKTFYQDKLFEKWTKETLFPAERAGIPFDTNVLKQLESEAAEGRKQAYGSLLNAWFKAFRDYRKLKRAEIKADVLKKYKAAVSKLKQPKIKDEKKREARYREKLERAYQRHRQSLKHKLKECEGFNLDSDKDMFWLLRDYFGYDIRKPGTGKESADAATLERLTLEGYQDIESLLKYRKYRKLETSFYPDYRDLLSQDSRIHCSFNPTGARTGRLSSSDPNLQQVPASIRKLFYAPSGQAFYIYDQDSIEAKLIAFYTEDPTLFWICENGYSIHDYNTKEIFFDLDCPLDRVKQDYPEKRKLSKEVGFALFYGAGKLRIQTSAYKHGYEWSESYCKKIHQVFKQKYRQAFEFKYNFVDPAFNEGKVYNLVGRPLTVPSEDVFMKGFNKLIQSSASDLVVHSGWRVNSMMAEAGLPGGVRALVHDELVIEGPDDQPDKMDQLIQIAMTDYELKNRFGRIHLELEGAKSYVWQK